MFQGHPSIPALASKNWLKVEHIMSRNVESICPGSTVAAAAKIMSDKTLSCLVVSNNEIPLGIVTETDFLKKGVANGNNFSKMKVEQIMSSPVRSVPPDLSVMEVGNIMEAENIRRLLILDDGCAIGIVTQTDLVRILASYTLSKEVSEIMSPDVAVIPSSASVKEAAQLMAAEDISCVVAMNGNTVAGIFTERDFLKKIVALKRSPDRTPLKRVMSSPVVTVYSDCSVLSAWKLLERTGIRRLVVMNDKVLVGILTQTDILKAIKIEVQEEEEDYFRLLSESPNCIFTTDLDLYTAYVNPAFTKLLDAANADEFMSKPFLPERFWDNPQERTQILSQLQKPGILARELALKTTKGDRLKVVMFSNSARNSKGEIQGSHGVLYDITAKRKPTIPTQTQERLQDDENPLARNPDNDVEGILVVDGRGRPTSMNRRFAEIWGIPEEAFCEQNPEKLVKYIGSRLEELPPFFARVQASCLAHEESCHTLRLKNGKVLKVYSLALTREEPSAGRIWCFRDITAIYN
jgi:CBS domain-containing protein